MKHQASWFFSLVFVFGCAGFLLADDPTSKFVPLAPIASTLAPSSSGLMVQLEIRDQAVGGALIYTEAHTVDTDADSNITNDTNFADLLLGRPNGLDAANFAYGSSRYLDVTQGGVSVLAARLPLYASVFSLTDSGFIASNLTLGNSTPTAGNILKGGVLFLHNFGTSNTFLGVNAGNLTMTGGDNTASGVNALASNTTGSFNTASGALALSSNTTGDSNTASGSFALQNNTTGAGNTANGRAALYSNTTGGANTATGVNALLRNTTGGGNTASGVNALASNTTGSFNTASGALALSSNTTGLQNTACGHQALQSNTTGSYNTASGQLALAFNTTGTGNTATGFVALYTNTIGSGNIASGAHALESNTAGDFNTAIGEKTLLSNTTGSYNTAIGRGADVSAGNLTNATAIGAGAVVAQSNSLVLGNNVNVGIGTSTPQAKLEVSGGDLRVSGDVYSRGQLIGQPVHTSAACSTGFPGVVSRGCGEPPAGEGICRGRVIVERPVTMGAICTVTSDTGSCTATSSGIDFSGICCVCSP